MTDDGGSVLRFTIPGEARGKGRPRFGQGRAYTDPKTAAYEALIGWSARQAMRGRPPISEAVSVALVISVVPPASASKARRARLLAGLEAIRGPFDIDNVAKAILDGMNRIAYADDRQVVGLSARYAAAEVAGVDVVIRAFATA